MSKLNRLAYALLLAQPLVVGAGAAFAFSMVDQSSSGGMSVTEPDAAFDNLSSQSSDVRDQPNADDSQTLLRPDSAPQIGFDLAPAPPAITPFTRR